jgi:hypothetical protein
VDAADRTVEMARWELNPKLMLQLRGDRRGPPAFGMQLCRFNIALCHTKESHGHAALESHDLV